MEEKKGSDSIAKMGMYHGMVLLMYCMDVRQWEINAGLRRKLDILGMSSEITKSTIATAKVFGRE